MLMNCYYVKNVLSNLSDGIMLYPTDAFACSQIVKTLNSRSENLNEYELHKIATFDTESSVLTPCCDTLIPLFSRDLIETPPVSTDTKEIISNINSVR